MSQRRSDIVSADRRNMKKEVVMCKRRREVGGVRLVGRDQRDCACFEHGTSIYIEQCVHSLSEIRGMRCECEEAHIIASLEEI